MVTVSEQTYEDSIASESLRTTDLNNGGNDNNKPHITKEHYPGCKPSAV